MDQVLILNADYRPLSLFPLSICSWRYAIKALFLGRVDVVSSYNKEVHSPTTSMKLPSIIVLKDYVPPVSNPAFSRTSLLIRDKFECQYCGEHGFIPNIREGVSLNMDHVIPRCKGGERNWQNIVASCHPCNLKKGSQSVAESGMNLRSKPHVPTSKELWKNSRILIPHGNIPDDWLQFIDPKYIKN